jgi:hypothetical protein
VHRLQNCSDLCALVYRVSGISIGISGLLILTSQELMDLYSEPNYYIRNWKRNITTVGAVGKNDTRKAVKKKVL